MNALASSSGSQVAGAALRFTRGGAISRQGIPTAIKRAAWLAPASYAIRQASSVISSSTRAGLSGSDLTSQLSTCRSSVPLRSGFLSPINSSSRAYSTATSSPPFSSPSQSRSQSQSDREEPESDPEPDDPPSASAMTRLKTLFKRYGWYALGMYTVLSAADFTLVFTIIHLAGAERIEPIVDALSAKYRVVRYGEDVAAEMAREDAEVAEREAAQEHKEKKKGGGGWVSRTTLAEIALAYPIHKIGFLPIRAGLTVAWTPKFVGWLTRRGWVGKGGYTRAASHAQDKLRTAKERVKGKVQDLRE